MQPLHQILVPIATLAAEAALKEPAAEPTVTPTPELTIAPTTVPTITPEPTAVPTAAPTATPTAAVTLTTEPTGTPIASPTVTPTTAPTATNTAIPTATPTVAPQPTAVPTPAPYTGYALLKQLTPVYDTKTTTVFNYSLPKDSAIYLDNAPLTETDRVQINYSCNGKAQTGFVAPDALKTLTSDEQASLILTLQKQTTIIYYQDQKTLPLAMLVPQYTGSSQATVTPTPAVTSTPTITATPTLSPTPTATLITKKPLATTQSTLDALMRNALRTYANSMTLVNCSSVSALQSSHPYMDFTSTLYVYRVAGAVRLTVTFSSDTKVETDYDVIGIYNSEDTMIASYTGSELAGKSITLRGDTVKILLLADQDTFDYGFRVTDVSAYTSPNSPTAYSINSTHAGLTWTGSNLINGYYVYRSTTPLGTYSYIGSTTTNSYVATVPYGQVSYFRILAYNDLSSAANGTKRFLSNLSSYRSLLALSTPGITSAVQNGTDINHAILTISPVGNATSYYVYRSASANGTYSYIGTFNTTKPTVSASTLSPNYYKVRASCIRNGITYLGPYSASKYVLMSNIPKVVMGTAIVLSSSQIKLNWNALPSVAGYQVFRSDNPNTGYTLRTTTTGTYYYDSCLFGAINYYKVRAYRDVNGVRVYGDYSIYRSSFGLSTPAITGITASGTSMILTWKTVMFATGYSFYHSSSASGPFQLVGTALAGSTTFTDSTSGGGGYYIVRAYHISPVGVTYMGPASRSVSAPARHYRALVIGQGYHNSSVSNLYGTLNDASGIYTMLNKLTPMHFSVTKRTDLTASGILSAISSTFAGASANDVSLFYYSGHGSEGGNLIGTDYFTSSSGYVSPTDLRERLDTIPGTKIVLVDSCFSGAIIDKSVRTVSDDSGDQAFVSNFVSAFAGSSRSTLAASGYYVITACHSTETSAEGDLTSNGVTMDVGFFSAPLSIGCGWNYISGSACSKYADANSDHNITLSELYSYVYAQVQDKNKYQHSQCYPSGSSYVLFNY